MSNKDDAQPTEAHDPSLRQAAVELPLLQTPSGSLPSFVLEGHTPLTEEQEISSSPTQISDPHQLQAWLQAVTAHSSDLMIALKRRPDSRFRMHFVSDGLRRVLGYEPEEFFQLDDSEFVHPDDLIYMRETLQRCASTESSHEVVEYRAKHKDETWRHMEAHISNYTDDPIIASLLINTRDITESFERENHLLGQISWFADLLSHTTDALRVLNRDGTPQLASGKLHWLLGDASAGFDQELLLRRTHPEDQKRVQEGVTYGLQHLGQRIRLGFRAKDPDDNWRYIELELLNRLEESSLQSVIITVRDLTARKLFDATTRLPSRTLFLDRVERLLQRRQRNPSEEFAALVVDVDRFGKVTDGLGAAFGERLLKTVGSRLMVSVRPSDYVGRLDRDKFTILLHGLQSPSDVAHICQRIHESVEQPCFLGGHKVFTTVTIGVAFSSSNFTQAEEMLQGAEIAMHRGKQHGGSGTEMFDPAMSEEVRHRLRMEGSLRHAIDRQEFLLHYQPIVSLQTRQLIGFEALCRWHRPGEGFISPGQFIPIAEETGMINTLGDWVLSKACEAAQMWSRTRKHNPPFVSINMSGKQLAKPGIVQDVRDALRRTRLDPSRLKLEVTETALISNTDEVADILHQLRDLGLLLALDDFGTGYSSLNYLHRFPFHTIKIDKSFTQLLGTDNDTAGIVPLIIQLARSLNMEVIAEGVETEEQAQLLTQLGCSSGQGFLFSRAMPEEQVGPLLSGRELTMM